MQTEKEQLMRRPSKTNIANKVKKTNIEVFAKEIAALVPVYDGSGGNATAIMTTDGRRLYDPRTLRWVIRRLCHHLTVDLEASRHIYGSYIGRRHFVPLPLSPQLILIPLYLRTPIVKGDCTSGYINLSAVDKIEEADQNSKIAESDSKAKSIILLRGNHRLPCYYTVKTAKERLRMGEIVCNYYHQNLGKERNYHHLRNNIGESNSLYIPLHQALQNYPSSSKRPFLKVAETNADREHPRENTGSTHLEKNMMPNQQETNIGVRWNSGNSGSDCWGSVGNGGSRGGNGGSRSEGSIEREHLAMIARELLDLLLAQR